MPSQSVADVYPLTPLQEGILFHCVASGDPALYVTSFACTLEGIETGAFTRAWEIAVERHTVLRTAFVWEGLRQPVQVVGRSAALAWQVEDWRSLAPAAREARWEQALADDPARLAKLSRAPLLRLSLYRTGETEHRFLFSHHHLILDGWSLPLLLGEVFALYGAGRRGQDAGLPEPRPFRDFVAFLQRQDPAAAEPYWRETLRGFTRPLQLGADRGHRGAPVRETATCRVALAPAAGAALQLAARQHGLTLNTLVQGAWALLLGRASGEDDLVFGVSVAGRPPALPGAERMIGIFTNTLPVRVQLAGSLPALDWLRRLQESLIRMRRFEHSPLARVQKWSELPGGQPLFEPILIFDGHASPASGAAAQGIAVREVRSTLRTSCPLLGTVSPGETLALAITYDRQRFAAAAAARLVRHWRALLVELAGGLAAPLDLIAWWSQAERHQILREWNDTRQPGAAAPAVQQLAAAQAAATPDAVAVVHAGRALSYGELRRRAARLAGRLRGLGIGPEGRVGIVCERSPEAITAFLAVLAAGGAYVPLAPRLPDERLRWLLADARPAALVTAGAPAAARLAAISGGLPVLRLDAAEPEETAGGGAANEPDEHDERRFAGAPLLPGQLAYLLYTSGSTGHPKGVMVGHRSLLNHVICGIRRDRLGPGDRMLQFAALSFDVSAEEIYTCLAAGATLVLREAAMLESPARFFDACRQHEITVLDLPTAFWHELAGALAPPATLELPPALRLTLIAGEQAMPEAAARWTARLGPAARLVNHYGPTEGTIAPTSAEIAAPARGGHPDTVPIGRPIGNTTALVLGREMAPVPLAAPGELYLGGACLARGYHGRPRLTAASFVPDPYSGVPGARLYRTGDLARRRADGELEFLGRIDQQVKVRGFRVEPGEIEAALAEHPAVGACAVVARGGAGSHLRLVAYVTPGAAGPPVETAQLRRFLADKLPDYMVPALFVALDSLPRNANGKVDRQRLPAPDLSRREAGGAVAPLDPVEERLAAIWREVLGVERVGVHDSFFELGGDSILSIQASSRARAAGLHVTPQQIFERRTIAALAAVARPPREHPAAAGPVGGPVPLTPVQRRFLESEPPDAHHFNQALLLALARPLPPGRLAAVAARLAERHDALRLRFRQTPGAGWQQECGPAAGSAVAACVDLAALPPRRWRQALASAAAQAQAALGLEHGPLLRALLLRGPAACGDRLLLVVHHLAVDGVSWRLLLADVEAGCTAAAMAEPPGTSFKEWAERLQAYAQGEEPARELPYWQAELGREVPALPLDGGGANTVSSARTVTVGLSAADTAALLREAPRAYLTEVNDLLLAALARTLARWTGAAVCRIELEGHGREEIVPGADLSRTVGWFTTMFPVCLEVPARGGDGELIKTVKEKLRRIPRRGIGCGVLRHLAAGDGGRRALPAVVPEIVFNYLGQLDRALPADGLLRPAAEPPGPVRSPRQRREHLLEIDGAIQEGCLQMAFRYSANRHHEATIASLADGYRRALAELIEHCRQARATRHTPSDFPLARLSQPEVEQLERGLEGELADVYPLSPLQRGMHFHALLDPDTGIYLSQVAATLVGDLDGAALRRAWETVVARHPALRTCFAWEVGDEPFQIVVRRVAIPWQELDWSGLPAGEVAERWARLLAADAERGFDLARAPLLRFTLVRTAPDRHLFAWCVHHLLVDGWSQARIFAEVFGLYLAAGRGEDLALEPAPPYRDYIEWLHGQDLAAAEAYWRGELRGFRAPTPLALCRPAAATVPAGAALPVERERRLGGALTADLAGLARRGDLTLNTILLGLWGLLLSRTSGEPEVVFGAAVAGRPADIPGVAAAVGLFLNTLPVRLAAPAEAELLGWLQALQARQVEARRFEHSPLVEVQGWSEVPRGQPLFESLLVYENYPLPALLAPAAAAGRPAGSELEMHDLRSRDRVNYALRLEILPGESLLLRLTFDPGRFAAAAVDELLRQLAGLCRQVVAEPRQPLGALSLVTPEALLPDPAAHLERPHFDPVPELFLAAARRWPQAAAICQAPRSWSYGELAGAAEELAAQLAGRGLPPGSTVAVQGERSFGLVVALIAVLRSGGVLLALDARLPPERRRRMLEEAQARLVLVAGGTVPASGAGAPPVPEWRLEPASGCVISRGATSEGPAALDPAVMEHLAAAAQPAPADPAYVFFTSGTTALPRAVLGRHQGLSHFLAWQREICGAGPGDRVPQLTGLSFDVVLREIFLPLTSGGTLCLPPRGEDPAPGEVLGWLAAERVTLLHAVPALATAWLDAAPEAPPLGELRAVFFAGEPLHDSLVRRWRRAVSEQARIVNLYGPTETTLAKCWYPVPPDPLAGVQPVGWPLPQTQALVLSPAGRRCGVGEPGEIVLRTPFRTLGYRNDAAENRRRFAANPWSGEADDLLYSTGDRGRLRPDGALEILGRLDDQVKIRGVRIDPHEVAAVLQEHPAVSAAAVVAGSDPRGETALVAYVVAAPGHELSPAELRVFAAQRLPAAMVPALLLPLPRLPMTPNGKVDRPALPPPVWPADGVAAATPPALPTPAEEIVAAIWAEVLGRQQVSPADNFFDLGGHSLLAGQMIARVRRACGVELTLRQLFAAPTVSGVARAVSELLRQGPEAAPLPLTPAPPDAAPVLSFAQERLWFLDQLDPGSALYNVHAGVRLGGRLDAAILERSLAAVVRRHQPLHTGFVTAGGRCRPVVRARAELAMPRVDLARLPAAARAAALGRLGAAQSGWPFDLARPPLLRAWLVVLGAGEHALLLTFHHIVADGWSIGLLTREVAALYASFLAGGDEAAAALAPLAITYGDFASWQRQWLAGEVLAAELAFWRRRLAGAPALLDLPSDRPRRGRRGSGSGRLTQLWPAALGTAVGRLARGAGATFFMALLAALAAVLRRYTGGDDLVVGTAVAGRSQVELEPLIGLFVNSLVLRADVGGDPGFGELLDRMRTVVLEAHAHQELPFEKLVEELEPQRDLNSNPLFQVMLVVQNMPPPARPGGELVLEPLGQELGTARLDLTFSARQQGDGLSLLVDFAADLFDAATVRRLIGHLGELLAAAAAGAHRRLSELPLLTLPERHQLATEWNDTAAPIPTGLCLHQLFTRQAQRTPQAPAVLWDGQVASYGELARAALDLARRLRALGVGPDVLVGLALPRSPAMLAAVLAVLTAGGAFVPFDPEYPTERLARMLADARPAVLIASGAAADLLPPLPAATRLLLLDGDQVVGAGNAADPTAPATAADGLAALSVGSLPDSLAYVIYTSGSTGQPHGVMVPHRAVVDTLCWRRLAFPLAAGDRILQSISLSFDPSIWQIFGAWTSGAALVLPRAEGHKDLTYLAALIASAQVTVADFPPSVLRRLLAEPALADGRLRHVFAGGEALGTELRDRFLGRLDAALHNVYGPTEGAIDATWWTCRRDDEGPAVPIGRPIANKQVLLLDDQLAPVPIGLAGELAIAGAGLARGYRGRPELTAERFRPHPSSASPGTRLYCTGDLARLRPDGRIDFLGRIDHQVKVRGVRVEPSEIEGALAAHPEVAEAVVMLDRGSNGDGRLVAYVAAAGGPPPPARELSSFLRQRLPAAMVPAAFVAVAAIPYTPTGKVDRQALARLGVAESREEPARVPPRTPREALLARVWCEVLGLDAVGVEDNFFAAGGDSILSIQIVARAARLGLRLSPRQLFEQQTIAELAAVAQEARPASEQGPVTGPLPLTPIQHWFFERQPAEPWHFNQSLLLELLRPVAPAVLAGAVGRLLWHHDALRLRFAPGAAGVEQQVAAPTADVPFSVVDLSALPESAWRAAEREREAVQRSLDLGRGPLLRATLFDRGERAAPLLLLVVHHLAIDGVSWRILIEDLEAACEQLAAHGVVELPPKTSSFQHWARRLPELAVSSDLERELDGWSALGNRPAPPLPRDFPPAGGADLEAAAAAVAVTLGADETRALLHEAPAACRARSDEILLAALALGLVRWTGETSLLLELEGHGRADELIPGVDLSRTVGWFTSIFPVRLELPPDLGPLAALAAVKEQLRAIPNRGIGYGILRYLGRPAAVQRLQALPAPEISFNYLGQIDRSAAAGRLLRFVGDAAGAPHSPLWVRPHPLAIEAAVAGGCLHLRCGYDPARHRRATIEHLAGNFLEAVNAIVTASRSAAARDEGSTMSDFPLLRGKREQLQRLLQRFGQDRQPEGRA